MTFLLLAAQMLSQRNVFYDIKRFFIIYFYWLCTFANIIFLIKAIISYNCKHTMDQLISHSTNYTHFIFSFSHFLSKCFHLYIAFNG